LLAAESVSVDVADRQRRLRTRDFFVVNFLAGRITGENVSRQSDNVAAVTLKNGG
jgi:hypothetical protein